MVTVQKIVDEQKLADFGRILFLKTRFLLNNLEKYFVKTHIWDFSIKKISGHCAPTSCLTYSLSGSLLHRKLNLGLKCNLALVHVLQAKNNLELWHCLFFDKPTSEWVQREGGGRAT